MPSGFVSRIGVPGAGVGSSIASPSGRSGGRGLALLADVDAAVVDAVVDVAVGGDLGLAARVDAVAGGRTYTGGA